MPRHERAPVGACADAEGAGAQEQVAREEAERDAAHARVDRMEVRVVRRPGRAEADGGARDRARADRDDGKKIE